MKFKVIEQGQYLKIEEANSKEILYLKIHLTRKIKNWKFNPKVKMKVWDGSISFFDIDKIPIGLWKECKTSCEVNGYEFQISNQSDFPLNKDIQVQDIIEFCDNFYVDHTLKDSDEIFYPYDYQIEAINKMIKYKYATIRIATGGGKSLTAATFIFYLFTKNPDYKFLIIVPTTQLVRQFYDDINNYNYGFNDENKSPLNLELEEIMSEGPRGKRKGQDKVSNIYIATWKSLINITDKSFFNSFDVVIIDECHEALDSLSKIVKKMIKNTKYRIGMSGTLPDDKSLEILTLQSITGPKVHEVKSTELEEKGKTTPVFINVLMLMHYDEEFNDNILLLKSGGKGDKAYLAERNYIQNSDKRMQYLIKLIREYLVGNTVILFFNEEYGLRINETLTTEFGGERNIHFINGNRKIIKLDERQKKQAEMEVTETSDIMVASYGVLSTGVNMKNIHNIVFADSFKSFSRIIQSIGRGVRLHKTKEMVYIWDLVDIYAKDLESLYEFKNRTIFYNHFKERLKIYKKEERTYKIKKVDL